VITLFVGALNKADAQSDRSIERDDISPPVAADMHSRFTFWASSILSIQLNFLYLRFIHK